MLERGYLHAAEQYAREMLAQEANVTEGYRIMATIYSRYYLTTKIPFVLPQAIQALEEYKKRAPTIKEKTENLLQHLRQEYLVPPPQKTRKERGHNKCPSP